MPTLLHQSQTTNKVNHNLNSRYVIRTTRSRRETYEDSKNRIFTVVSPAAAPGEHDVFGKYVLTIQYTDVKDPSFISAEFVNCEQELVFLNNTNLSILRASLSLSSSRGCIISIHVVLGRELMRIRTHVRPPRRLRRRRFVSSCLILFALLQIFVTTRKVSGGRRRL